MNNNNNYPALYGTGPVQAIVRDVNVFWATFWVKTLETFQGGVVFVSALQTSEVLNTVISGGAVNVNALVVIALLVITNMIMVYFKEHWLAVRLERAVEEADDFVDGLRRPSRKTGAF